MSEYYYEERSDRIYHKKYLINRSACTTLLDGYEVCKKLKDLERKLEEAREALSSIRGILPTVYSSDREIHEIINKVLKEKG